MGKFIGRLCWIWFCASLAGPAFCEEDVRFSYAFVADVGKGEEAKRVSIRQDTTLSTGESLQVWLRLETACYVYLIHRGPDGSIRRLLPEDFEREPAAGQEWDIPGPGGWFELDEETGEERFYLIASRDRLGGIEAALRGYESHPVDETGKAVLAAIRETRKRSIVTAKAAERPISFGGAFRGENNSKPQAVEVVATGLFLRTLTIDHR